MRFRYKKLVDGGPYWSGTAALPKEAWYRDGRYHADDHAALITYRATQQGYMPLFVRWYTDGEYDRQDGPATTMYDYNGEKIFEGWYKRGVKHRDGDQPAYTRWRGDGSIEMVWYKDGVRHRDGGLPAVMIVDAMGRPVTQEIWERGRRLR